MLKIILLGLSVSIDSWAVGAAYHAFGIRIPRMTKMVVSVISTLTALVALAAGCVAGTFMDTCYLRMAGGAVLVFIGARALWNVWTGRGEKNYDVDASNSIEFREGLLLGVVLASDSFCGALSLCGTGMSAYVFPFVVGGLTLGFLVLAEKEIRCGKICDYLAGVALVAIGVLQMLGI